MTGEQLLNQLIDTARRKERDTHEELIRLRERLEQARQHRMELEELADQFKRERLA